MTSEFTSRPDVADMMIPDGYGFPELGANKIVTDGVILESDVTQKCSSRISRQQRIYLLGLKAVGHLASQVTTKLTPVEAVLIEHQRH